MSSSSLRILVIRRDNIGDLLCTTPLLHGLRKKYPSAYIAVLASSYNVELLRGNPDVDDVFVFLKRYQREPRQNFFSRLWKRWRLVQTIRKHHFDHIILANGGWRYARSLGGKELIGFRERHQPDHRQPDVIVPLEQEGHEDHEVTKMALLGAPLGVTEAHGPLQLFPDQQQILTENQRLISLGWDPYKPTVALHISSRQPEQRWPESSFISLAQRLVESHNVQILLFWAPGEETDRMHPGDDQKAQRMLHQLTNLPVFPCPTKNLQELVAGVSLADQMICSDGGTMHIAAALKKPIVCFFGPSNVKEWHPWHTPHIILQPPSKMVASISVEETLTSFEKLTLKTSTLSSKLSLL